MSRLTTPTTEIYRCWSHDPIALWRARDRYRAQRFLEGLVLTPFLFLAGMSLLLGEWGHALGFLALPLVGLWAVKWVWRHATRTVLGWWSNRGIQARVHP